MTARVFERRCVWRLTEDGFAAAAGLLAHVVHIELAFSSPRRKTRDIRLRLHPASRRCGSLEDNQYTARPAPCDTGAHTELSAWTTGPVDAVVGVAHGGRPLAERLARALRLPVLIVQATHNRTNDVCVPASGDVHVRASASLRRVRPGSRLVIADDICGTGATLAAVSEALTAQLAADVVATVTLCRNRGA